MSTALELAPRVGVGLACSALGAARVTLTTAPCRPHRCAQRMAR